MPLRTEFVLSGMTEAVKNQPEPIKCPKCAHEIQIAAGWARVAKNITCPKCLTLVILKREWPTSDGEWGRVPKSVL
jgi:ribosomal protein S27E